ncbi:MAG TPA: putative peptidoglycan glycosyltransferase FtsW [Candidatus Saccharimonadales bacterium]|nr:putative peptidoglycan glycosyltransferase FtsW [Candidatus Saccharimonadales bacterium]
MGAVTRRNPGFVPRGGAPRRHRPDYILVILSTVLLAVGLVVVYAISPALAVEKHVSNNYFVTRQLISIGLGLVVFGVTAKIPLSNWRKAFKPLLVVAALATLMALALPTNPDYPAHRWIRFGGLSFQSVELLKFALLVGLASFLAERMRNRTVSDSKKTLQPLLIALGVIGFVVAGIQSDLGSTGVIVAMMGVMAFVAGMPMKRLMIVLGVIGVLLVLAISATPYRRERLFTFLHPESNCLTTGYQACQALISVGSGGMIGLGLGRSVQAYGYLPEAENDSIFAIYAEKFGFVGAAVLLALLMALFARFKNIAERAPDNFSRLVVVGVLAWFSTQAIINIGAMIGLLPLKGITLPFISYGGSSVLLVMGALGLVFQVSRYTSHGVTVQDEEFNGESDENSRNRRRIRGAYHPDLSGRP